MEGNKNLYPPLSSNYITIVDLQNRWLQQKQQQQQQQQEQQEEKEEQIQKNENNHNLSNKFVQKQQVKSNSQFQKFNRSNSYVSPNFKPRSSFYGKKKVEEFQVVKEASNSSEINCIAVKKDGYCEEKSSRFRKTNCSNFDRNPNFGNRKPFYRNVNGEKRLKEFQVVKKVRNAFAEESKINVDDNSTEIDDQKVEDEKKTMMKKKIYRNKKRNRKVVDECRKYEERENEVDDQTVEEKDDDVIVEDQTVEKKKENQAIAEDQTVEKKDDQVIAEDQTVEKKKENQAIVEDQTVEKKDEEVIVGDRTVEKKDEEVIAEDQTVEKKDEEVIGEDRTVENNYDQVIAEDQTVEEKNDQVIDEDQTVEIDQKLKELSVSGLMNGRSTAVIEGRRREYGGYGRGYRRGYYNGRKNWGSRKGGFGAVDGFFGRGRSTVEDEGWRGMHRGYSGDENRGRGFRGKGEFMWVKKE